MYSTNGLRNSLRSGVQAMLEGCLRKVGAWRRLRYLNRVQGTEDVLDVINVDDTHRFCVWSELGTVSVCNCLGLQFGMGINKLSIKLTQDMGRPITVEEARELKAQHQEAFPQYWEWVYNVQHHYKAKNPLYTREFWPLWPDNPSILSAGNFPIQGNGAAIAHTAFNKAIDRGLDVIITLHDYLGIYHREEDTESPRLLAQCMDEAVEEILNGRVKIRLDKKVVTHKDVWIEPKGRRMFDKMARHLYQGLDDSPIFGVDELLG